MKCDTRAIHLPSELCEAAERRFGSRFGSLEEFLRFVLNEFARGDAANMDQAEQRIIEQRLKDLGYV
jgi:hypothetical protein